MKYFSIFNLLFTRAIKLFFYYILITPFFILKFFLTNSNKHNITFFNKFLIIIIGEVWLFGKNILDLRQVYESQRLDFRSEHTIKKLLKYLPGQWQTLSPLESSLTILMSPKDIGWKKKFFYTPYVFYIFLFDESRHSIKANHGIACALALSYIFKSYQQISDYYYLKSLKILRLNSNYFFYDEGSTNYHIFVTSLFRHYFNLCRKKPSWFEGFEDLSIKLLTHKSYFYFGDDDNSQWLFTYRDDLHLSKNPRIIDLIKNDRFNQSVLKQYFNVYIKDNRILLLCIKGSQWGHSHLMVGSFLYFIDNKSVVVYKKNSSYTLNRLTRRNDRLFSCNGPINLSYIKNIQIEFFKKLPQILVAPINVSYFNDNISLSLNGWRRDINFSKSLIKIIDSASENIILKSSLDNDESELVEYSNLTNS